MESLLVLAHRTDEARRSPELRYLFAELLAHGRSVFPAVAVATWQPGEAEPDLGAADSVLVLGAAAVHFTASGLERMRGALAGAAAVVLPDRLEDFAIAEPIYTLRGFERFERRIVDEGLEPRRRLSSHLPVALFAGGAFRELLEGRTAEDVLTNPELLAETGLDGRAARAGLYHRYIDYYGEVREDVLAYLPDGVESVLEVGCGRGLTGALVRERRGCRVTGVELNPEIARDAARRLDAVVIGDVLTAEIDGPFDAVVATELFEHLNEPEAFLARMRTLLVPGGRIVLSVPNVGHWSVVEDLLAGRWDYLPIGLLCYTHFRFFTRATLASWLRREGFGEVEIVPQTTELPERFSRIGGFDVDVESLRTKGFYVVLRV